VPTEDIFMTLKIYNTLTRTEQRFKPMEAGKIRLYVCGITVYDYCHIGHARVLVAFDAMVRYLRSQQWDVTYVRNITDIDDKILARADANGEPFTDLTARMIAAMHEDERALGVLPPSLEPRATAHIDDIIAMVDTLIDNHYAYRADNGDVYYRVRRFANYGRLSGKIPDELLAGARVEVDEFKEDPRDFALWKAAAQDQVGWESPWGRGRPGWHIECSAMATCLLGETFDIHGGGPDLPFPHHENEIAQSEAATGKTFVHYWMHAGAVRVDDEKMSKSLNNFFTIRDVLEKYHGEVVRYFLLSSHYRSAINYSETSLIDARQGVERFYLALRNVADVPAIALADMQSSTYYTRFIEAMNRDFNTPEAFAVLHDLVRALNNATSGSDPADPRQLAGQLKALGNLLGLLQENPADFLRGKAAKDGLSDSAIEDLIAQRVAAKKAKDFARSDAIREQLMQQGIVLEDSRSGTQWRRQ